MPQFIEFLAVVSGSIYGVLLARQHKMDFVGVFSLAFIVAFGGGTLRDLVLDRHPLFWIRESHYPVIVFAISLAAFYIRQVPTRAEYYLSVPDALGLGLFSVAGTSAALDSGTSLFIAAMMGTVTGAFGGVIGDIICNRIPSIFRPSTPLFATCSFVGSWVYVGLHSFQLSKPLAAPVAILFIVLFRLAALTQHWTLPSLDDESGKEVG